MSQHEPMSLRVRALLAFVLTLGFYALALALVVVLATSPLHGVMALWKFAAPVAAAMLLWSLVPRRAPEPFGVEVGIDEAAALQRFVAEVARAVGTEPPKRIFITAPVEAFVTERRPGPLRRVERILGLGLPLLALLSQAQLRAVVAHELGHYANGDTRLGRWSWRTAHALGRTLERMKADVGWWVLVVVLRICHIIFSGYAWLYRRITAAVSRRQEFAADAVSARVAGGGIASAALLRVASTDPAVSLFWNTEAAPVLEAGRLPPLVDGMQRFVRAPAHAEQLQAAVDALRDELEVDRWAQHPPVGARVAAMGEPAADATPPAAELVDAAAVEARLAALLVPDRERHRVAWDDVTDEVLLPRYRAALRASSDLSGIGWDELPARVEARPELMPLAGMALTLALEARGWGISAPPGEPLRASAPDGERVVEPFALCAALTEGERSGWDELAQSAGPLELAA